MKASEGKGRLTPHGRQPKRAGGFALVELLIVLLLSSALLMLGMASVFVLGPKLHRSAVAQWTRLASLTDAAEQFRADVAGAVDGPDRAGPYRAGADTLILRVGDGADGAASHLIWHWDGAELWRVRWNEKSPKYGRLGAEDGFGAVAFHVVKLDGRVRVSMELEPRREPRPAKVRARPSRLEIVAVLGADRS